MARRLERAAEYMGLAAAPGSLYRIKNHCGLIYQSDAPQSITGDVFALPADSSLWRLLDDYEDYRPEQPKRSVFLRVRREIRDEAGRSRSAWLYTFNRDPKRLPVIESGDFLAPDAQTKPAQRSI